MPETILITGASGLIGSALTSRFLNLGFNIHHMGRKKTKLDEVKSFHWNPAKGEIDLTAFENVNYIINLAGSNVSDGRWTSKRKLELESSRIQSQNLLANSIRNNKVPIRKFISASAIGFYGLSDEDKEFKEGDPAGSDFLARLTEKWESTLETFKEEVPTAIIRIGVVLSKNGGAFVELAKPIKLLAGAPLGSGRQYIPWIHIDDIVKVFEMAVTQDNFTGTFNAVAPNPVTNKKLTQLIGKALKKPIWPLHVPGFLLKLILGEMGMIVLKGNRVSCEKLLHTGMEFKFPEIDSAIAHLTCE